MNYLCNEYLNDSQEPRLHIVFVILTNTVFKKSAFYLV